MDTPLTHVAELDLEKLFKEEENEQTQAAVSIPEKKWKIKSYSDLSSKLDSKDALNKDRLQSMGFNSTSIGNNDNTRIIYPKEGVTAGESLPVVILQGGDGADKRYYNNFFNNYRSISGTDLPRAIYVLAPNYGKENSDENAYQYVKQWMDKRGISASQIGIETFSGGGGTGVMMATQAAKDNKDVPVTLLLLDGARDGCDGHGRSFSKALENLAKRTNITVVGATKEYGGLLKDIANIIPDRTFKIKFKDGDYKSHSGVRKYALYYDFMLSLMGLSTKLKDNEKLFTFRKDNNDDDTKLDNSASLNDILKNINSHAKELGAPAMDVIETSSSLFALDEFINELNTDITSFSSVEGGNVGGNDLLTLESNASSALSTSINSLAQNLSLDTVTIRSVGENIEEADKATLLKLENIQSLNNSFNNFTINKNLIKNRERIIEVPENKNKDGNKNGNKNENKNKGSSSYTPGYNNPPENNNSTQNINPGTYLVGKTADGGNVIATYDGKQITNLAIQYDLSKLDYITQNKDSFTNIANSIKQYNDSGIIEIIVKNEIFENKNLNSIKTILNII